MGERKDPILGWKLGQAGREALLNRFPPRFAQAIADHVTHGRKSDAPPLPQAKEAVVIGRADDDQGVEALVVEIDGASDRWDGSTYHITWSLAEGREAKESNAVIAACGWQEVPDEMRVGLEPAEWP